MRRWRASQDARRASQDARRASQDANKICSYAGGGVPIHKWGTPRLLIWNQAFSAARHTIIFKADFYCCALNGCCHSCQRRFLMPACFSASVAASISLRAIPCFLHCRCRHAPHGDGNLKDRLDTCTTLLHAFCSCRRFETHSLSVCLNESGNVQLISRFRPSYQASKLS